jgi:hypothetical protein
MSKTAGYFAMAALAVALPLLSACDDESPRAPNPQPNIGQAAPVAPAITVQPNTPEAYGFTVLFNREGCQYARYLKPGEYPDYANANDYIYTTICKKADAETVAPQTESCGKGCTRDITNTIRVPAISH